MLERMDTLTQEIQSVKLELSILSTTVKCLPVHQPQDNSVHQIPKVSPPDSKPTEVEDSLDGSFLSIDEEIIENLN